MNKKFSKLMSRIENFSSNFAGVNLTRILNQVSSNKGDWSKIASGSFNNIHNALINNNTLDNNSANGITLYLASLLTNSGYAALNNKLFPNGVSDKIYEDCTGRPAPKFKFDFDAIKHLDNEEVFNRFVNYVNSSIKPSTIEKYSNMYLDAIK